MTPPRWQSVAWAPSYRAPSLRRLLSHKPTPPRMPDRGLREARCRQAVVAHPDADAPRRAYADAVGGDRGELIRVQLAIAQAEHPDDDWLDREADLRPRVEADWQADLSPWAARDLGIRRGFPESASLAGRAFIRWGEELLQSVPLRQLRLLAIAPYMDELARCPHLARLVSLDLSGNRLGPDRLDPLLQSPHLAATHLDLSGNHLGEEGLRRLTASCHAPRCRSLALRENALSRLDPAPWQALEHLDLSGNRLDDARIPSWLAAPALPRLRSLAIRHCRVRLSDLRGQDRLERLDAGFTPTPEAIDLTAWPRLRHLALRGCHAPLQGLDALNHLAFLDLSARQVSADEIQALMRCCSPLRELHLANCGLEGKALNHLGESGCFRRLRVLSLAWNPLGEEAILALARSEAARSLRLLDLRGIPLSRRGLAALREGLRAVSPSGCVIRSDLAEDLPGGPLRPPGRKC